MKNVITKYLVCLILLNPLFCFSQCPSVELKGNEGKRINELADKFAGNLVVETKAIRFIYLNTDYNGSEYYFGLITSRHKFISNPPSYYFFNSKNEPIVVYTGFEKNVKFSQTYVDELMGLADKYLWTDDVVITMHYYVWYLEFKNGREIEFSSRLSKRRQKKIPSWLTEVIKSD
jgi:YHS domain-containing protein